MTKAKPAAQQGRERRRDEIQNWRRRDDEGKTGGETRNGTAA
jgi:hypothetical protein